VVLLVDAELIVVYCLVTAVCIGDKNSTTFLIAHRSFAMPFRNAKW